MKRIAIVAALRREVKPLVENRNWKTIKWKSGSREFAIMENDRALMVCGGMGRGPAGEAAEALHEFSGGAISLMVSAGLAGALVEDLRVGDIFCPATIYGTPSQAGPGSLAAAAGRGGLVSAPEVAGEAGKKELHKAYGAEAVDMEAFSVAQVAQAHSYPFVAVKAISDKLDFAMPEMRRFIDDQGEFRKGKFAMHAALRPGMWRGIARLNKNSMRAVTSLCKVLNELIEDDAAHHLELISALPGMALAPAMDAQETSLYPDGKQAR